MIFKFIVIFPGSLLDLTPSCNNTCGIHRSMRGNANLEVTFKEAIQKTISVLMHCAASGGISVGKDFDIQLISSDY